MPFLKSYEAIAFFVGGCTCSTWIEVLVLCGGGGNRPQAPVHLTTQPTPNPPPPTLPPIFPPPPHLQHGPSFAGEQQRISGPPLQLLLPRGRFRL